MAEDSDVERAWLLAGRALTRLCADKVCRSGVCESDVTVEAETGSGRRA